MKRYSHYALILATAFMHSTYISAAASGGGDSGGGSSSGGTGGAEDPLIIAKKARFAAELKPIQDRIAAHKETIDAARARYHESYDAYHRANVEYMIQTGQLSRDCEEARIAAAEPLLAERDRRREPVLGEVRKLQAFIQRLRDDYDREKSLHRSSVGSSYARHIDKEMYLAGSINPLRDKIDALLAAADGDIYEQIRKAEEGAKQACIASRGGIPASPPPAPEMDHEAALTVHDAEKEILRLKIEEYNPKEKEIYDEYDRRVAERDAARSGGATS